MGAADILLLGVVIGCAVCLTAVVVTLIFLKR